MSDVKKDLFDDNSDEYNPAETPVPDQVPDGEYVPSYDPNAY